MPQAIAIPNDTTTGTPTKRRSILPAWMGTRAMACVWLVLIAYGTLVPFDFEPIKLGGVGGFFAWLFALMTSPTWITSGANDVSSLGTPNWINDLVVNCALYGPLGALLRIDGWQRGKGWGPAGPPGGPARAGHELDAGVRPEPHEAPHRLAPGHPDQHRRRPPGRRIGYPAPPGEQVAGLRDLQESILRPVPPQGVPHPPAPQAAHHVRRRTDQHRCDRLLVLRRASRRPHPRKRPRSTSCPSASRSSDPTTSPPCSSAARWCSTACSR